MSDSEEIGITVRFSKADGFSVRPGDQRGTCCPVAIVELPPDYAPGGDVATIVFNPEQK